MPLVENKHSVLACAGVLFLLLCQSAVSEPYLVRNINTVPISADSDPEFLGVMAGVAYFSASNYTHGRELWRTDGTMAGTSLVKDIQAGVGSSNPKRFVVIGGVAYFAATTDVSGTELWRTDGTEAGTQLVVELAQGAWSSDPAVLGNIGATIFIVGYDGSSEHELWRADGTSAGTYRLAASGSPAGARPNGGIVASNGKLYFTGFNSTYGAEPWVTDGTLAGTRRLNNVVQGTPTQYAVSFVQAGSYVYFLGSISPDPAQLFRIRLNDDGVERVTTVEVRNYASATTEPLISSGNLVLFVGQQNGVERVWRSDGTTAGTFSLIDYSSQMGNSYVAPQFTKVNGRVVFTNVSQTSPGLISTDGTVNGTVVVDSAPMVVIGATQSHVYYHSYGGPIRRTDGTVGSARMISLPPEVSGPGFGQWLRFAGDANATYFGFQGNNVTTHLPEYVSVRYNPANDTFTVLRRDRTSPRDAFATWGGRLFFAPPEIAVGYEPWVSDGTTTGTRLLANITGETTETSSSPAKFFGFRGHVYFAASDGIAGRELWRSDGTSNGTQLVADLVAGEYDSAPHDMFAAGDSLMMFARDGTSSAEYLWRYVPSTGTVQKNTAVSPPYTCTQPTTASLGGVTFFPAFSSSGVELWRTDGTITGTRQVEDVTVGVGSSNPCQPVALGGRVFFTAQQFGAQPGYALWVTDSASSGAQRISALGSSPPSAITTYNNAIYYLANNSAGAPTLWRSDGTAGGTTAASALPMSMSAAIMLGAVNDKLLFVTPTQSGRLSLWTYDASGGFVQMQNRWLLSIGTFTQDRRRFFFTGFDLANGMGSWVTDGTEAGTLPLSGPTGVGINGPQWLGEIHNTALFATDRIWRSDGTVGGTRAVHTGWGAGRSLVSGTPTGVAVDNKFYFAVADQIIGTELYAIEIQPPVVNSANGDARSIADSGAGGGGAFGAINLLGLLLVLRSIERAGRRRKTY